MPHCAIRHPLTLHDALPISARIRGTARNDRIQAWNGVRDTVSCGHGRDLVTADASDRVARDCEVVSREISRDRSEEHTSELQSPVQIVCRLLLENQYSYLSG